jgi:hypothetical protein
LLALVDQFRHVGSTHVAMAGSGVNWKPLYHLLEDTSARRLQQLGYRVTGKAVAGSLPVISPTS